MAWQSRLVVVLVHFVWQGAIVAGLLALLSSSFKQQKPSSRYAASLFTFAVMSFCPLVTWFLISFVNVEPTIERTIVVKHQNEAPIVDAARQPLLERPASASAEFDLPPAGSGTQLSGEALADATEPDTRPESNSVPAQLSVARADLREPETGSWQWIKPCETWIVTMWLAGVLLLSLRLAAGAIGTWVWRTNTETLPDELAGQVQRLCEVLSMRVPRVRLSRRVAEGLVVGLWRPMVLLPVSWVMELPPDMLEAVLAHELAHLRRFDLWVNLCQRVVETLLFYHPAVWWLSYRLRVERELCCDALAITVTRDPVRYAETLERIACFRVVPEPSGLTLAIRSREGVLLHRIRQLLGIAQSNPTGGVWFASAVTFVLASALGVGTFAISQADQKTASLKIADIAASEQLNKELANAEPEHPENDKLANETEPQADAIPVNVAPADFAGDARTEEAPIETRTVHVVDDADKPVAGAEVRFQFERRTAKGSEATLEGPLTTGEDGIVTANVPYGFDRTHISVAAEGFARFSDFQPSAGTSTIRMKRGRPQSVLGRRS